MLSLKKYPNVNFGSILGSNVPFYLFLYIMSNGKICCVIEAIEKINTGRGHLCVWPWCRCCSTPGSAKTAQSACALLLAVLELGRIVNNLKKCKKVAVE